MAPNCISDPAAKSMTHLNEPKPGKVSPLIAQKTVQTSTLFAHKHYHDSISKAIPLRASGRYPTKEKKTQHANFVQTNCNHVLLCLKALFSLAFVLPRTHYKRSLPFSSRPMNVQFRNFGSGVEWRMGMGRGLRCKEAENERNRIAIVTARSPLLSCSPSMNEHMPKDEDDEDDDDDDDNNNNDDGDQK